MTNIQYACGCVAVPNTDANGEYINFRIATFCSEHGKESGLFEEKMET